MLYGTCSVLAGPQCPRERVLDAPNIPTASCYQGKSVAADKPLFSKCPLWEVIHVVALTVPRSLKTTAWTQKLLLVQCSPLFLSFKKKIQARKHSYSVDIKGFPKTQLWEKEACALCTPHIQRAFYPPMKHLTKTCSAPSLGRQAPLLK